MIRNAQKAVVVLDLSRSYSSSSASSTKGCLGLHSCCCVSWCEQESIVEKVLCACPLHIGTTDPGACRHTERLSISFYNLACCSINKIKHAQEKVIKLTEMREFGFETILHFAYNR